MPSSARKMMQSWDRVNLRCMRLLLAQHGMLSYSKLFFTSRKHTCKKIDKRMIQWIHKPVTQAFIIMYYVLYIIECVILLEDWQHTRLVYSPQTHEWCTALRCCDGYDITRRQEFFSSIIILWDHHCIWGPLLPEMSLCGMWLYIHIYINTFIYVNK